MLKHRFSTLIDRADQLRIVAAGSLSGNHRVREPHYANYTAIKLIVIVFAQYGYGKSLDGGRTQDCQRLHGVHPILCGRFSM